MPTRRLFRAATIALLTVLALISRFVPTRFAAADTAVPAPSSAQFQSLYQEKCSACHNLPDPQAEPRTRPQWHAVVNQMLNRYHASDSISPTEAAQIVDYLATFAPEADVRGGRAGRDPWASDAFDVWTVLPVTSRVFNFEAGPISPGLSVAASGPPGPAAVWRDVEGSLTPDGDYVKVVPAKADASRFALLIDRADQGRNVDIRMRFRMIGGHVSPSVGIAFGLADPAHYSVLRYDAKENTLSVVKISPDAHIALQSTRLTAPAVPGTAAASAKLSALSSSSWHTLRLLVNQGEIRGWIDGMKRISTLDPSYIGGSVALWTQGDTIAAFSNWTADFYDGGGAPAPPRA